VNVLGFGGLVLLGKVARSVVTSLPHANQEAHLPRHL
jgi:hypothetical protein